ncbi:MULTISPECIES: DUF4192 domain-containing protein [Amycolatopsis]|uniref:DUF4192 domain-containing protein n=1 Tax=Amycolatopsis albidoflavus TaxID=102226 RepID=A0ABW5HSB2_9PSEU
MPLPNAVAKFLASVPAVCGFYPEESIVVIHMKPREDGRERVGLTMRLDIDHFLADPVKCSEVFAEPLSTQTSGGIVVIAVSKKDTGGTDLPWCEEIETLTASLIAAGHPVRAVYFLPEFREGVRCRCYCPLPDCGGVLPDPTTSPGAVAAAAAGFTVQPSRRSLEDLFAPASEAERAPIETATHQVIAQLEDSPRPIAERLAAFDRAVTSSGEGPLPQDREHIAHLIASFTSPLFRDACVLPASGTEPELERLNVLMHLHRLAPAEFRPRIGTALAAAHCLIGEYLQASMAAQTVQPPTPLADLVADRVSRGTDPFAPGDGFSGYFRSARDCATVMTRTVAAVADPLPRLRSLVTEAAREIEAEHSRFDYWALQARLHRIDSAVTAWANGLRPDSDKELADLIAGMSAPRLREAALVPPSGSDVESAGLALFRHLLQIAPLECARHLAGAVAFGELAKGDVSAARAAAAAIDPPSQLSEAVRLASLVPTIALQTSALTAIARAERDWLERPTTD